MEAEKWEYHVETAGSFWSAPKPEDLQTLLNAMGADGWKLVSAYTLPNSNQITLIARRPLTDRARRERSLP